MKIRATIAILAAMMFTPALRAQSTAAPTKVGVINMQAAITGTAEGKQAVAELQSQFAPRQTELQTCRSRSRTTRAAFGPGKRR